MSPTDMKISANGLTKYRCDNNNMRKLVLFIIFLLLKQYVIMGMSVENRTQHSIYLLFYNNNLDIKDEKIASSIEIVSGGFEVLKFVETFCILIRGNRILIPFINVTDTHKIIVEERSNGFCCTRRNKWDDY